MTRIRIDIDDEALEIAMRLAAVRDESDMVNLALREYAGRRVRADARLRHFAEAKDWDDSSFWRRHEAEKP